MKKVICFLTLCACISCSVQRSASSYINQHTTLADSLLADALDNEALYSILDSIKPISSVKSFGLELQPLSDSFKTVNHPQLDSLILLQQLCKELSSVDLQFVTIPYQQTYDQRRIVEVYAVNINSLKKKILEYASFFSTLGITTETTPAQLITIIESAGRYDRWRGYGYLFGYPSYAVDFFVNAGKSQDSTSQFVSRDFFQIPVFRSASGHFTYAMPKGYQPGDQDSSVYRRAMHTLDNYSEVRKRFVSANGLKALQLFNYLRRRR